MILSNAANTAWMISMIFLMEKYQAKDHDADYNELMKITAGLAMMS